MNLDLLRRRVVIAESAAELAGRKLDPAPTKTGKTRIVPLFSDLADELGLHDIRLGDGGRIVPFHAAAHEIVTIMVSLARPD